MINEFNTLEVAVADLSATADVLTFTPGVPIDVVRWGLVVTTVIVGAPVIAADKRITAGSDTGRVNAAGGTLTPGTLAAGKGGYIEAENFAAGNKPLEINPGEQFILEVTTGATSGAGTVFVEYKQKPFQSGSAAAANDRLTHMTEFTA
ncbi:MAG: hypothetical protein ACR2QC_07695 [Gammaproteobacteria bacterium]